MKKRDTEHPAHVSDFRILPETLPRATQLKGCEARLIEATGK
ncbi:hypothetical protein SAMN04489868_1121 [Pisciglobus halotolerans]|uniref:Uncharacterized protein n=1 Tax=Pisciglobus halotolerans TaxID=745365 RepID=A0A1I3C1L9_9LACT|nr:hypothetical protein SAMN04489868_1121 [Pisciglobus halotolerans]